MKNTLSAGVFLYNLNGLVPDSIDYAELAKYAIEFPNVSQIFLHSEFPWTEDNILKKVESYSLDRLVIAGAIPGTIKTLFSKVMALAGKDPENVVLASFNEYGIFSNATIERAKAVLACAISDVPYAVSVVPEEVPVNPGTLIIGGGITGCLLYTSDAADE